MSIIIGVLSNKGNEIYNSGCSQRVKVKINENSQCRVCTKTETVVNKDCLVANNVALKHRFALRLLF